MILDYSTKLKYLKMNSIHVERPAEKGPDIKTSCQEAQFPPSLHPTSQLICPPKWDTAYAGNPSSTYLSEIKLAPAHA